MNPQSPKPPAAKPEMTLLKVLVGAISFAVAYFGVRYLMSGGH